MLDRVSTSSENTPTPKAAPAIDSRARGRHRAGRKPESAITALLREHPRGVPYPRRRHRSRSARTAPPTPLRRPASIWSTLSIPGTA